MQSPEGVRLPRNEGCFLLIEPPHRITWTGVLSRDFRPQAQKELDFGFVCDLSFTALQNGGSRFKALVMHSDAEGKAKHEQMGFDSGWRIALSQLVELYE